MSPRAAIVGSGIAGTLVAARLVERGWEVDLFERGPAYPYPHQEPYEERVIHRSPRPIYERPADVEMTQSGDYPRRIDREIDAVEGGSAVRWEAIAVRQPVADFATRTRFGHGVDWPLSYDELEPYYGAAEREIGVAGTDADNVFAPPRSTPFPLPPFELSVDDRLLQERLERHGVALHTTPQARTRHRYDGRLACANVNACGTCPIGARYSPQLHLRRLLAIGRCRFRTGATVRRIVTDRFGEPRSLLVAVRGNEERTYAADVIVVAAGAFPTARLLLVSTSPASPDGLGNAGGQVGRNLVFHHLWIGRLRYRETLFPGRVGAWTGQSHQFLEPDGRGRHGGVKVEFSSRRAHATHEPIQLWDPPATVVVDSMTGEDVGERMREVLHWRPIVLHAESLPDERKYLELGARRDGYGDPLAHVHYEQNGFDRRTHGFARSIFRRFRDATGAIEAELVDVDRYYSGFHHLGTCRMGDDVGSSVVDRDGRVHGTRRLFVVGGSVFCGSGTVNPTLTIAALSLRTASVIADRFASRG